MLTRARCTVQGLANCFGQVNKACLLLLGGGHHLCYESRLVQSVQNMLNVPAAINIVELGLHCGIVDLLLITL
jgi:hypothetical protein